MFEVLILYIKNMVSIRCQMAVKSELERLGINYTKVEVGEVEIISKVSKDQLYSLAAALKLIGLELMVNNKLILVERIKTIIIDHIHNSEGQLKINFSDFLSKKLNYNFNYLSNLFIEVKGTSIEQYFLSHKIEKVKELLVYDELNLTEIAWKLNFNSVSHLSNQFKKRTGLTPSHFKNLKTKKRTSLENLSK